MRKRQEGLLDRLRARCASCGERFVGDETNCPECGRPRTCPTCGLDILTRREMHEHEGCTRDVPPPHDLTELMQIDALQEEKRLRRFDADFRQRQRRASQAGVKVRAENSDEELRRFKEAALRYRYSTPYQPGDQDASTRKMARDLAEELKVPFGTVRDRLTKLGIR